MIFRNIVMQTSVHAKSPIEFFKNLLYIPYPLYIWSYQTTIRFQHQKIAFRIALKDQYLSEIET
jgi:hypothetical protein